MQAQPPNAFADDSSNQLPVQLTRRYELRFTPLSSTKQLKLRDVKAGVIGRYVLRFHVALVHRSSLLSSSLRRLQLTPHLLHCLATVS
jgi:hypothetical protein